MASVAGLGRVYIVSCISRDGQVFKRLQANGLRAVCALILPPGARHVIKVNRRIFKILYRLTLPGSLLLVFTALLIRVGVLADPQSPLVRFLPIVVFTVGLALSAFFRRSRLFFAFLATALAQGTFTWVLPSLSSDSGQITRNAISILLPLNLLVLAFLR